MSEGYLDRTRGTINKQEWQAHQLDKSYTIVRRYLSDRMRVTVEWKGGPFDTRRIPYEHCKPFELRVWNLITGAGSNQPVIEAPDPSAGDTFRSEREAVDAYEHFLASNGGGEWLEGASHFIERGNKLAPVSPDTPCMDEDDAPEDFGSWG